MGATGKDGVWNAKKKYNFYRIRLDACACKALDGLVLQPACGALLDALCDKQPRLRAAAATPESLLLALSTPKLAATCALKLLEPPYDAPISEEVRALLLKPSKLAQLVLEPQCVPLVKVLIAKDAAIKDAAVASDCFAQALKPATAMTALALLEHGADVSHARDVLLADGAKLLRSLVLDPNASSLVDALCAADSEIKATVSSPEMLLAALSPSSAPVALRLMDTYGVEMTEAVLTALTQGAAPVASTTALKFDKDVFLEDNGSEVPLGNSDYTMEFWIRFGGEHGCFVGWGHEPENGCNGCHFEGHGFNHFWYANDLHPGNGGRELEKCWMHLVLRGDKKANKRAVLIDGKLIGDDKPGEDVHDVKPAPLFIGGRFPISWAPDHDPLDGAISEVRLWKRALSDEELGMELNAAAPPDDLVRWFCFTDEDAESGNTVRNHAAHGPSHLDVKEESRGSKDIEPMAAEKAKAKWTTRAEIGETDVERTGAPRAVPRHVHRLLAMAADPSSAPLLDALVSKNPSLKAALAAVNVLVGAFVPRSAAAALRLLEAYDLPIGDDVVSGLLDNSSGKGSRFDALLLHGSKECALLIDALITRAPSLERAAKSDALLIEALKPETAKAALQLIEERSLEITDKVREHLMTVRDSLGKVISPLEALVLDASCMPLIAALCAKDDAIKAAVTAPAMIAAVAVPEKASTALKLIETYSVEIGSELSALLLAKDDKGRSKLLGLMAKSAETANDADGDGGESESERLPSTDGPVKTLLETLIAKDTSATIKAAVVSADMFIALAKPATAGVAFKLVDEMGLVVGKEIVEALLTGQTAEYYFSDKKMDWQGHEDAAVAWGGHLASIHSMEEHEHVKGLAKGHDMVWLGGRRIEPHKGNGPGPEHWIWSDGTSWDFENWGPGEPNNSGGREDRIHLLGHYQHKWNDIPKEHSQVAVYKRGGRPLDSLILSKEPAAIQLVDCLLAKAPTKLVPAAIVAACKPGSAATALKLLDSYPAATLDKTAVMPLLANEGATLTKLMVDNSAESQKLVDVLCAKSAALKAAATAPAMLRAALSPAAAHAVSLFLEANQADALAAALEEISAGREAAC